MAPETIVAAVPAKTSWKKNLASRGTTVHESESKAASPPPRNQPVCPNAAFPYAKHQAEPNRPEGERCDGKVHQVLHHDVDRVLAGLEACLDEGEARLHEEHERPGYQDPQGVQGDLFRRGTRRFLSRGGGYPGEQSQTHGHHAAEPTHFHLSGLPFS